MRIYVLFQTTLKGGAVEDARFSKTPAEFRWPVAGFGKQSENLYARLLPWRILDGLVRWTVLWI